MSSTYSNPSFPGDESAQTNLATDQGDGERFWARDEIDQLLKKETEPPAVEDSFENPS